MTFETFEEEMLDGLDGYPTPYEGDAFYLGDVDCLETLDELYDGRMVA